MVSEDIKKMIMKFSEAGKSAAQISKELSIPRSTVRSTIKPSYKKKGLHPGPSPVVSKLNEKSIAEAVRKIRKSGERITSKKVLNRTRLQVSTKTIQRTLRKCNMRYKKIPQKIELNDDHKRKRIEIAKQWIFDGVQFKNVIFTDEKKFNLDGPDNFCTWINENMALTRNRRQCGGGGIMVHGAMGYDGYFRITKIQGNLNGTQYLEVFQNLTSDLNARYKEFTIMQDNAPVHKCKAVTSFIASAGIKIIPWPARSPDLNLIENVWHMMADYVYNNHQYRSLDHLLQAIYDAAEIIQKEKIDVIKSLYHGFPDRIEKLFKKDGDIIN